MSFFFLQIVSSKVLRASIEQLTKPNYGAIAQSVTSIDFNSRGFMRLLGCCELWTVFVSARLTF
jgi:hypothetical protein